MANLTRGRFLKQTSATVAGVAAAGMLAGAPHLTAHAAPALPADERSAATLQGPLVAHVRDIASGEVALMIGAREIVVHDHELVARLVKAAR
jgi:hypothetical protein